MTTITDIYVVRDDDRTAHYSSARGTALEYSIVDGLLVICSTYIDGTVTQDTYKHWESVSADLDEDEVVLRVIHDEA